MIDPESQLGRLCRDAAAPLELPTQPLYSFDAAREAAVSLGRSLCCRRPHLLEDAEQTALLATWEATSRGTAEVEFEVIKKAVQRAIRELIGDCTERRREGGEPPPYSVDFPALLDAEAYTTTREKQTLQQLVRLAERYGTEAIVTFTRLRYCTRIRQFSSEGAGRRCGIGKADAKQLDLALRRVNPAYRAIIEKRRSEAAK